MKQPADAADQIGLIGVEPAVGIHNLPQHLHYRKPVRMVVAVVDGPREAVQIGRLVVGGLGLGDQGIGLGVAQPEVRAQRGADGVPLIAVEVPVHARRLDEQRRRRELRRLCLRLRPCPPGVVADAGLQKCLDSIEHRRCLSYRRRQTQGPPGCIPRRAAPVYSRPISS